MKRGQGLITARKISDRIASRGPRPTYTRGQGLITARKMSEELAGRKKVASQVRDVMRSARQDVLKNRPTYTRGQGLITARKISDKVAHNRNVRRQGASEMRDTWKNTRSKLR